MKKFDIKWLLILVLVVILAFGLVACGNKGGSETPEEEEEQQKPVDPNKSDATEFFATLWDASKSLGAETVNPNTDKVHIGLDMDISLTSDNVAELDVGVKLGLVADLAAMNKQTNPDLGDTALMLQAYDKVTSENWITLWYFLSDKDYIYLKVQKESFKVGFDAYWNNEFSTLLQGVLAQNLDFLADKPIKNILGIINGVAASGGDNWTLDTLILGNKNKGGNFDGLLSAFGLNLSELLASLPEGLLGKGTDTSSLGSILKAMGGVVVESSSCKKYTNADGSKTYTANKLSTTATTLLNNFTDNLFKSISSLSLTYNVTSAGAIDDLIITIAGKKDLSNAEIKIAITDLTIKKTTAAATTVLNKEASYKPYAKIAFEGYMDASLWGIELDPDLNPATADIKIGKVKINLDATIDLIGAGDANKTAAKLTITNDIGGTSPEEVLTATYVNHVLTLKTDLSTANNKAIAVEALSPLCDLIKKASVGEDAIVAYKIFGDMADEIRTEMFGGKAKPTVADVNADFKSISITGVDIKTLAKGAFYAIFSGFATGSDKEKPAAAAELTTYAGDKYKLGSYTYEKGQYAWALDIKQTATVVLKAIKYAGTASQKDKDYSIELSSIAATLKSVFKKASIESIEKTKEDVAAPANVDEMMALFMCTNDGILLDLTKHGYLPLYEDGVGITNKYIDEATDADTNKISLADAIAAKKYYAVSGKMISKADALLIWNFLTGKSATLKLSFETNTADKYYNYDADEVKVDSATYVANSAIAWFVKFMNGTTLLPAADMTSAKVVEALTGTNSSIKISLNRKTGYMGCEITLAGKKLTGTAAYRFFGSNDNATSLSAVPTITGAADYTVNLGAGNFYALFEAAFGMGPTTSLANGHGINTDLYIIVDAVPTYSTSGQLTSVSYAHQAIILSDGDDGGYYAYKVTDTDVQHLGYGKVEGTTLKILDESNTATVLASYTIYGDAYKLIKQN